MQQAMINQLRKNARTSIRKLSELVSMPKSSVFVEFKNLPIDKYTIILSLCFDFCVVDYDTYMYAYNKGIVNNCYQISPKLYLITCLFDSFVHTHAKHYYRTTQVICCEQVNI